jgi:SAM-dependent methyltransferase
MAQARSRGFEKMDHGGLMDIRAYNRRAWDREVALGNRWTVPVSPEEIAAAREGRWTLLLTPTRPIPREWFPSDLAGRRVLCLACGGGQQGPLLAAAGARVTVLDNSPRQLAQDRLVAEREGLVIETVEGDMADLSMFPGTSFELIVHPVANCFVPDVRPVWREAFRVLRPSGAILAGFANPMNYIFDLDLAEHGTLAVCFPLPYADTSSLPDEELQRRLETGEPVEFSHTLEAQIGGQLEAGFLLAGFYEDRYPDAACDRLSYYMATFMATRAIKR